MKYASPAPVWPDEPVRIDYGHQRFGDLFDARR
jgi:hypothetical protein